MPGAARRDTGVPTTNARFLKFSEPVRERQLSDAVLHHRSAEANSHGYQSSGSQSGDFVDGRWDAPGAGHFYGPLEDFAYARTRRPVIKTEDVSGIEKSGLRNMLDKKSDDVRKGLAKTFGFSKKKAKHGAETGQGLDTLPESSATVRPGRGGGNTGIGGGYPGELDGTGPDTLPGQQYPSPYLAPDHPWNQSGNLMSLPPSSKLPAIPTSAAAPLIKRWVGAGRPVQRWNKLLKDTELWDPNGDVLIFLGHRDQSPRPDPSFRLSSHIIDATGSRHLKRLLREGLTEDSSFGLSEAEGVISYEMYFPASGHASQTDQVRHHIATRNVFALMYHASLVGLSLYQALVDVHARLEMLMAPEADNVGTIINFLSARGIDDVRNDPGTAVSLLAWSEGSEVRWEEGWRESFVHCAGMYPRLKACADFKSITPITRELMERASLETQLRVQAAAECLGEFEYGAMWPSSVSTTANTANTSGPVTASPAKGVADRLRGFLIQYYSRRFGRWPPLPPRVQGQATDEDMWLTRTVAQTLQKDFSALYDFLVNRDIVWDGSEARSSRKWVMVSESGNKAFEADTLDLPMTDMLIEFDNKSRFPHIPHPYSLVPESIPPLTINQEPAPAAGGIFGARASKKTAPNNDQANNTRSGAATECRIQLAYTEATNICLLGSDLTHSDLIDAFTKFEKTDRVGEVDPSLARRSRWVLIYGILQTLASVSVDSPTVRYRDEVSYHLSSRLKGAKMPPWKTTIAFNHHDPTDNRDEARHDLSYCWTVPRSWNGTGTGETSSSSAINSGAESSADEAVASAQPPPGMRSYRFPRPPASATTGRSSAAGYHSAWSVASSVASSSTSYNYPPPLSSAGTVISESDVASSVRTPISSSSRRPRREFGAPMGMGRVEEHHRDWSDGDYGNVAGSAQGSDVRHYQQQYVLSPLRAPGNLTRTGPFLMGDGEAIEDSQSGGRWDGEGRKARRRDGGGDLTPVIKDFDDLSVPGDNRF